MGASSRRANSLAIDSIWRCSSFRSKSIVPPVRMPSHRQRALAWERPNRSREPDYTGFVYHTPRAADSGPCGRQMGVAGGLTPRGESSYDAHSRHRGAARSSATQGSVAGAVSYGD